MFFDDEPLKAKKDTLLRVPPPVPETGWKPPRDFPNLSTAKVISLDTETYDPDLMDYGPGWARKRGHIVGASLAAIDQYGNLGKWYFPVRHEMEAHDNLDPAHVFPFLKDCLETPHIPKVGANLTYDIGWLTEEGIEVQGELNDVQFAEALIDEDAFVSLDILGYKYARTGKDSSTMYKWQAETYGGSVNGTQRKNIYRTPPRLVGYYAEQDAELPIIVAKQQYPILLHEELLYVYRMECGLIPLLIKMRKRGVTVDLRRAEQMYAELATDIKELQSELFRVTGVHANVNSAPELAKVFDAAEVPYPKTAKGAPSFRKEWLTALEHPIADIINNIREHHKIRDTFIKSYLLESNIKGKIHCQFHQLKGENGGTGVGRMSSSSPNLQNIPSRGKLGKKVRECFIPDPGHLAWEKDDYSQIHYRILAHTGVGAGADDLRNSYIQNPNMDYHDLVYYRVCPLMGWDSTDEAVKKDKRRPIKNINFGLLNGQGESALAYKSGFTKEAAKELFKAYFEAAPYIKPTMVDKEREATETGHVKSLLGRRKRFKLWEPNNWDDSRIPLPYEEALKRYGTNIKLAFGYRALNYYLQPTEADIMKSSLLAAYKSGVFEYIGYPSVTVHDELGFSVIDDSRQMNQAYEFLRYTMANTAKLNVPIRFDSDRGPNWGKCG